MDFVTTKRDLFQKEEIFSDLDRDLETKLSLVAYHLEDVYFPQIHKEWWERCGTLYTNTVDEIKLI